MYLRVSQAQVRKREASKVQTQMRRKFLGWSTVKMEGKKQEGFQRH